MTKIMKSLVTMVVLCALPTLGLSQNTGTEAFAAQDYAKAEQLWAQEAAAGSAEAMLSLGLLADSGYRGTARPETAFGWYLTAARLGLAEAQMTVALSYDAGLGHERELDQALIWYTRAALRGHTQAQENLGLMYVDGDSGSANADQARYWFEQAGARRDVTTAPRHTRLAAPQVVFAEVGPRNIEIAWQTPATANPVYELEILDVADDGTDYQPPLLVAETAASGLLIAEATLTERTIWRIINPDKNSADYQATPWQGAPEASQPKGRITFVVDSSLPEMARAAAFFAQDLRAAGYWVRLTMQTRNEATADLGSFISYGYQSDFSLADQIAQYLPGPADGVGYVQQPGSTRPGEIIVHLMSQAKTTQ